MDSPVDRAAPSAASDQDWPAVDVVVPVMNEAPHLASSVEHILNSSYPGETTLVLALGPSVDGTDAVARRLVAQHPSIQLVSNPSGSTPAALNAALAATSNPIVVRVDAHGFVPDTYIQDAVETLLETGAANVGGVMAAEGKTPFEKAVACAMSSRIGIGSAPFHVGGHAGPAESVYLGVFRRDALERLGGFDEHFSRAQDWELNFRLRQAGEVVWFDPRLRVGYRPRSSYRQLAKQFNGSGRWRREVIARYPATASLRYVAAPLAVVGSAVGLVVGVTGLVLGSVPASAALLIPAGYAVVVVGGGLAAGRGLPWSTRRHLPGVVACMHASWGLGFLQGRSGPKR